jgi:hypothetical protein
MSKTILLAVGLALLASPALSQGSSRPDDRDAYSDRRDRGWARERDGWHDDERGGPGRGARFMLRNGDAVVAVRCDGSEPMRACVDATLTLLDRVRSLPPPASPSPGSTQPPR